MRVVLVQPPIADFYDTDIRLQPIGLCYLKASVKAFLPDVEVIIRDYHHGHGRRTVPLPKALKYLRHYYPVADKSPFSTFHQYYHFGASFEAITADLICLQPDVIGITSLFTPYFREALAVARHVKQRLNVPIVFGGSHVSAAPDTMLTPAYVDYVIRGEGERPFVELLRALQGQIDIAAVPNLGYKQSGEMHFTPLQENYDLDDLPPPDLSDVTPSHYTIRDKPLTFLITSRSCPHRCSFCSVHTTFGTSYRRRRLDHVLAEIEQRYEEGYRVIDFEDDNLTFYKRTFKELCRQLIRCFPARDLTFVAMNGISYLSLDDELLELMAQAGFAQLNLALVSSDKSVRETTKRPHTLAAYLRVVQTAFRLGLSMVSYQILGLPQESLGSMIQTLAFNACLPVRLGASPFYQTPASPIARGLALSEDDFVRARLTAMAVETPCCRRGDLYTLFVITRMVNFLKDLTLEADTDLETLWGQTWPDARTQMGCNLLQRLATSGTLYFHTKKGLVVNQKFQPALWQQVLQEARYITCQNGRRINVSTRLRPAPGVHIVQPAARGQI